MDPEPSVRIVETRHEWRVRKRHRCNYCRKPIEVGTLYTNIDGLVTGVTPPVRQRGHFHLDCTPPVR